MKKISNNLKNRFLLGFFAITMLLALVRLVFPSVAKGYDPYQAAISMNSDSASHTTLLTPRKGKPSKASSVRASSVDTSEVPSVFFNADGSVVKHKIIGVPDYETSFPDMNDVQLLSAKQNGVSPVQNRVEAEHRKQELVFVGYNPYYEVKKLYNSIPYLVPTASVLLQEIGRSFMDSLQLKGIPANKILVTSVLRTKEDIAKLRSFNRNASENSCHQYGTTFDIAYNKYYALTRPVRDDTLKWVLAEVLNTLRSQKRCYVKHECHQGCFHITVR